MLKIFQQLVFSSAVTVIFLPLVAFAYIDPGTGSFLIQILAAAIFGASFAFRFIWKRIFVFFKRIFGIKSASDVNGAQKNGKRNSGPEKNKQ